MKNNFIRVLLAGLISFSLLDTVFLNPVVGDTWVQKTDMPTTRGNLSACTVNGKIYVIGGETFLNNFITISTVEEYDPLLDRWTVKANMPTPRIRLGVVALNGKIYAIGGSFGEEQIRAAVEEYDPAADTWTKKANMPRPRNAVSVNGVNGKIYVIGGWDGAKPIFNTPQFSIHDKDVRKAGMTKICVFFLNLRFYFGDFRVSVAENLYSPEGA